MLRKTINTSAVVAMENQREWNWHQPKTMTGKSSLLGLFSLAVNGLRSATVLNESTFMETVTNDITLKHESDEQRWSTLMANAQAGNESDYRQLLTELTNVIYNFLCSRFGSHHFTEDCVQDTLIAIHQARHTYDQRRPFRPWLFAIVRHKAIDTLRKQHTRQKVTSQYKGEQEILSQTSQQSEAESEIIRGRLLESLSEQHREVLVLTKIIGFSIVEAAEKLGISESLVKVRVHRAIRKLRQMMEADKL
jgi:RNA polymerase sigma-70 factor (ECF subfamily)